MASVDMVLSVLAADRPGLVERLAAVVTAASGNWVDSSLSRLGGEFAGIVRVSVPTVGAAAFETALKDLAAEGITVVVRLDDPGIPAPIGRTAQIELTGADHPGIVHEIARLLAAHDVSIDELQTEVFTGSMSGGRLFSAKARIVIPASLDLGNLQSALEDTASDLMVDLALSEE